MSFFTHLGLVKKWYIVDKSKKGNFIFVVIIALLNMNNSFKLYFIHFLIVL